MTMVLCMSVIMIIAVYKCFNSIINTSLCIQIISLFSEGTVSLCREAQVPDIVCLLVCLFLYTDLKNYTRGRSAVMPPVHYDAHAL